MPGVLLGSALVLLASFGPDRSNLFGITANIKINAGEIHSGNQLSQRRPLQDEGEKLDRPQADLPAFIELQELKISPADSKLTQLYKLRQNAARDAIESRFKEWVAGRGTLPFLIRSAEDLLTFRLDLASSDKERLAIRTQFVEFATEVERLTRERFESRRLATQDLKQVECFLLDAKIEHLRASDQIKKR
jgi:hypothetical protein